MNIQFLQLDLFIWIQDAEQFIIKTNKQYFLVEIFLI
jgi:hypothetical protein